MNITLTANLIERHARSMGLRVTVDWSNVSESRYVVIDAPDTDELPVKVRVSRHTLPPSYAAPDYEVGPHAMGAAWAPVLRSIARRFDKPTPPTVSRFCARLEKAAAARQAEDLRRGEEAQAQQDDRAARAKRVEILLARCPATPEARRVLELREKHACVFGIDGRKARHLRDDLRRAEKNLLILAGLS